MENKNNNNPYSKTFKCSVTKYYFQVTINNEHVYINNIETDYSNIMAFFTLMRNTIGELKTLKVKYIIQSVYVDEYNNTLKDKTTWKIVRMYIDNTCDIMCPVDDYISNYDKATGSSGLA